MKTKLMSVLLVLGLLLPMNANAFFFDSMVNEATEVSVEMMQTIKKLSDDIGLMADKILVMADKIGEMAERIVETEKIMAEMATDIAEIKNNGTSTSGTPTIEGVYLIQGYQTTLYRGEAPRFEMSQNSSEYLVYVSSSMTMNTNTVSVLVHNQSELSELWSQLEALTADHKIFVAVKIIENNSISSLSNVLSYNTTF